MMNNIAPSTAPSSPPRDYDALHQEIEDESITSTELRKISFKLLDENELLKQENKKLLNKNKLLEQDKKKLLDKNKKQHSALEQIHFLMYKLYLGLENKMSEIENLEKCLVILQSSQNEFVKDCLNFLINSNNRYRKEIPRFGLLLHINRSVKCSLCIAEILGQFYGTQDNRQLNPEQWKIYSEAVKEAIQNSTTMLESLKNICNPQNGERKSANRSPRKNGESKRRKRQARDEDSPFSFVSPNKRNREFQRKKHSPNKKRPRRSADSRKDEPESSSSDTQPAEQTPVNNLATSNDIISDSCKASCRRLVVRLVDVLNDPAADYDPDVARYKQANSFLDIGDNEFKVVDDVSASGEEEDKPSDDDTGNNCDATKPDGTHAAENVPHSLPSVGSPELDADSRDQENEEPIQSQDVEDGKLEEGNCESVYHKGPKTPPSPCPSFRRGPHTPPYPYFSDDSS